jgi:hypothetical protein
MNTPVYNAQFLTIDFRMLDNPAFGEFMKTTAFAVYLQLRRYIWRSRTRRHPIPKVNELFEQGNLVATAERTHLAKKLGIKEERHISRHISELCRMGVIERISTGRQNLYILGTWEDRSVHQDGSYVIELFLLERHFGVEHRPQIVAEEGEGPSAHPGEVPTGDASGVSMSDTSEVSAARSSRVSVKRASAVSPTPPYKYRSKKIEKQQRALSLLKSFPFSKEQLGEIAAAYPVERIAEVVVAYRERGEGRIENPAGWVLAALRDGYEFDSAAKRVRVKYERRREEETVQAREEAAAEDSQEEIAARVQAWIEEHPVEYRQIWEEERERWKGSPAGESTSYLHACARVRVQEQLSSPGRPAFTVRPLNALLQPDNEPEAHPEEGTGPHAPADLLLT